MSKNKRKRKGRKSARKGAPHSDAIPAQPAPASRSARISQPGFSGLAIAGFVLAFLLSPLGLVFSALALHQIGRKYQKGRGLAIAGLVCSIVFLVTVFPTQLRAMQLYIQNS